MSREEKSFKFERSPRKQYRDEDRTSKIQEMMKSDLQNLEDENAILKAKCGKIVELQTKVEMVMRQNSQLLSENEKISKLFHEKKSEYEILKNKYDNAMANRMGINSEAEREKRKLINQIDYLKNQIQDLQRGRNTQINEVRNQTQLEIHALKRQNSAANELYEQQIRKLKDQLEKREYDNGDQVSRLKRLSSDYEYEVLRLKEEKDKLKNELIYLENDHRKDIQNLKTKLQINYNDELETLKKNHASNFQALQAENYRLKQYLDNRTQEIQQLEAKLSKQKSHFEENINLLNKQNETIRFKMMEGDRCNELQMENLKSKLNTMYESEIEEIKFNHQRYIDCLQTQVTKMESILKGKNEEIQQLVKQKTITRQANNAEIGRLNDELQALEAMCKQYEDRLRSSEVQYENRLKQKQDNIQYLQRVNHEQKQKFSKDLQELGNSINLKELQLEGERIRNAEKEEALQNSLNQQITENGNLKDKLQREKAERYSQVENLSQQRSDISNKLQDEINDLLQKNHALIRQNQNLKNALQMKELDNSTLREKLQKDSVRSLRLEQEIQSMRELMNKKDRKSNQAMKQMKQRLESSFALRLESLNSEQERLMKIQDKKLEEKDDIILKKERQLGQLLKNYRMMREKFQALTEQEANRKQMTLKYPGATADLISTKNLFDVYLKTKVLDVCQDVLQKQNRS